MPGMGIGTEAGSETLSSRGRPIRVLVADDHEVFREGLKQILELNNSISIAGEAGTSPDTIQVAEKVRPDVVLLDVSMPGRGGLETIHELKRLLPEVRILVLTAHPEDHYAIRCLKGGAEGYITKEHSGAEISMAIRKVAGGGMYISPSLAERLAFSLHGEIGQPPHEALSDREFQVMTQIASGKTVSEIAAELLLSVKTVSTYRARVLEKMDLKNNAEIMQYAMREGLV